MAEKAIIISLCFQVLKKIFKISGEKNTLAMETDGNHSNNTSFSSKKSKILKKRKEKNYIDIDSGNECCISCLPLTLRHFEKFELFHDGRRF